MSEKPTSNRPKANLAEIALERHYAEKARAHNRAAFTFLLSRSRPKVLGVLTAFCGKKEIAEEAVQVASFIAWRRIETFKGGSTFSTWLIRIAMNAVKRMSKTENRYVQDPLLEEVLRNPTRADWQVLAKERVRLYQEQLATLREEDREVVELKFETEATASQIAKSLGVKERRVRTALDRALAHLGLTTDAPPEMGEEFDYDDPGAEQDIPTETSDLYDDAESDDGWGPDRKELDVNSDHERMHGADDDEDE